MTDDEFYCIKVVRCKECRHYNENRGSCAKGNIHGYAGTWFCADGEPKEFIPRRKSYGSKEYVCPVCLSLLNEVTDSVCPSCGREMAWDKVKDDEY